MGKTAGNPRSKSALPAHRSPAGSASVRLRGGHRGRRARDGWARRGTCTERVTDETPSGVKITQVSLVSAPTRQCVW